MADHQIKPDETSPKTIWQELDAWAASCKPWHRYILTNAIRSGRLTEAQIDSAYAAFLHESELGPEANIPKERRSAVTGRPSESTPPQLRLTKIDQLKAVNALLDSAVLTFSPNLTIIYGGNGVGKSGFARILSCACFSRSQQPILSNIYDENAQPALGAELTVADGDGNETHLKFDGKVEHAELKRIAIFDTSVARTHISETGPLGFKPAGFDVFPEMARVYGELSKRLTDEIARRTRPNNFVNSFVAPESYVSKFVAGLSADTDLEQLRTLAKFDQAEQARLDEVQRQIQDLQSKSVAEAIAQLAEAKSEITQLKRNLEQGGAPLSEAKRADYRAQLADYAAKLTLVAEQGEESFKQPFFKAVGSPQWENFLTAAHALAHAEDPAYPRADDHCLLCHRPLDDASRALIQRFWVFLASEVRQSAETAKQKLDSFVKTLTALRLSLFSPETKVHAHVLRLNPTLAHQIAEAIAAFEQDRLRLIEVLSGGSGNIGAPTPSDFSGPLATLLEQIDADIARLREQNVADALKALESERVSLRHRQVLNQLLPEIEKYVADLAWIKAAAGAPKRSLNPRPLTDKEAELFSTIIVAGYRTRFADECTTLDCNLPVELRTKGERGQTVRSLAMKGGHSPDRILSEGEQRAVALADFLTEVNLNPANAGIVLDDPVTSQDHQRKERIAKRLVAEAQHRQVIVFTHDMVFLTMLAGAAAEHGISILTHWIERDANGRPGQVSLDDCPATTPQYRDTKKAQATLAAAQKAVGSARIQLIQRGMGELRRTLEEIVPHFLFKQIVNRWSDRVIVTKLGDVSWDNTLAREIAKIYEEISAYIEGHSHTEERTGAPAEPKDLEDMIGRVNALRDRARGK